MKQAEYRAAAAKAMSETELQNNIIQFAQLNSWCAYHTHDSRRSQAGFPDLVLVRDGHLIFAELKSQTGRLSEPQAMWCDELFKVEAHNMVESTRPNIAVYLWRPSMWLSGEIQKVLQ